MPGKRLITAIKSTLDAHNEMERHLDALDHVERGGEVPLPKK